MPERCSADASWMPFGMGGCLKDASRMLLGYCPDASKMALGCLWDAFRFFGCLRDASQMLLIFDKNQISIAAARAGSKTQKINFHPKQPAQGQKRSHAQAGSKTQPCSFDIEDGISQFPSEKSDLNFSSPRGVKNAAKSGFTKRSPRGAKNAAMLRRGQKRSHAHAA